MEILAERLLSYIQRKGAKLGLLGRHDGALGSEQVEGSSLSESGIEGRLVQIEYVDSKGLPSCRDVTIREIKVSEKGEPIVSGYCHLRQTLRSFRGNRIQTMICKATGEVLSPIGELTGAPSNKVKGKRVLTQPKAAPGMRALLFLAWSDGQLHEEEVEVILRYADHTFPMSPKDQVAAKKFISTQSPDVALTLKGLRSVASNDEALRSFLRFVRQVVEADGEISRDEVNALSELHDRLGKRDGPDAQEFAKAFDEAAARLLHSL